MLTSWLEEGGPVSELLSTGATIGAGAATAIRLAIELFASAPVITYPFFGTLFEGSLADERGWLAINALLATIAAIAAFTNAGEDTPDASDWPRLGLSCLPSYRDAVGDFGSRSCWPPLHDTTITAASHDLPIAGSGHPKSIRIYDALCFFAANPALVYQHRLNRYRRDIIVLCNFMLPFFRIVCAEHVVHCFKWTQQLGRKCPLCLLAIAIRACRGKESIIPTEQSISYYSGKRKPPSGLP